MRTTLALVVLAAVLAPPALAAQRPTNPAQMRSIVNAWSDRLNAGDNAGVARLFATPSVAVQGSFAYRFETRDQVAFWHSKLPCSGRIVSIKVRGRYATAVFRLGNRRTSKCDAPGELAAARFEIVGGKVVSWVQVPAPEGEQRGTLAA
jgi:hypothetical protein